jgi:methionyl-tRNA formyltransferase
MKIPRVIAFGYDELLLESLDFLSKTQIEIAAAVFPSSRQDWRSDRIREIVKERGFSAIEQPLKKEAGEFVAKLRKLSPDLILVWSYPMILPNDVIEIPRYGCVNVHLGLLPEYRGVNGIRWALLNGEEKTGVTLHFMDAGIDTGDMIARASFPILPEDDILSLMKKSKVAGLHLLENSWNAIISGKVQTLQQDESKANYYSAGMEPSEVIDWLRSSVQIHNLIRASAAPYPGVYTHWNGSKFTVRKSLAIDVAAGTTPGTIEKLESEGIEVATGLGRLRLTRIELEGQVIAVSKLTELGLKVGDKFQHSATSKPN